MLPFRQTLQSWCLEFNFLWSPILIPLFWPLLSYQWIWITCNCQVCFQTVHCADHSQLRQAVSVISEVDFHALCNETCSWLCNVFYASKNCIAFQIHKPCSSHGCWQQWLVRTSTSAWLIKARGLRNNRQNNRQPWTRSPILASEQLP